jgi:hypothetical protein
MAQWAIIGLQWKGWSLDEVAKRVGKLSFAKRRVLVYSRSSGFSLGYHVLS